MLAGGWGLGRMKRCMPGRDVRRLNMGRFLALILASSPRGGAAFDGSPVVVAIFQLRRRGRAGVARLRSSGSLARLARLLILVGELVGRIAFSDRASAGAFSAHVRHERL